MRCARKELCSLKSFKVPFLFFTCWVSHTEGLRGSDSKSSEVTGRLCCAPDCTLSINDNCERRVFQNTPGTEIESWTAYWGAPASCWLQSWFWLWTGYVEIGGQTLCSAQQLVLISGALLSPPPSGSLSSFSPSPPLPFRLFRFALLLLMNWKSPRAATTALVLRENCPCSLDIRPVKGIFAGGRNGAVSTGDDCIATQSCTERGGGGEGEGGQGGGRDRGRVCTQQLSASLSQGLLCWFTEAA